MLRIYYYNTKIYFVTICNKLIFIDDMIPKLKDLLNEAKVHRLQIFTPGTGGKGAGNFKFNPSKIPTGKLRIGNQMACQNKPVG